MAQAIESDNDKDDDEDIDIPDPDDDDGHELTDIANLYTFHDWWTAGQQPISFTELTNMPRGMWQDFKYLLSKYANLRKLVKKKKTLAPGEQGIRHRGS